MKLTIKELAPYLPYGLKCKVTHINAYTHTDEWNHVKDGSIIEMDAGRLDHWSYSQDCTPVNFDWKPLLRPLSDLTEEIEHEGKRFVPIKVLQLYDDELDWTGVHPDEWDFMQEITSSGAWTLRSMQEVTERLFEWHIDVFGLIDKGLAIKK